MNEKEAATEIKKEVNQVAEKAEIEVILTQRESLEELKSINAKSNGKSLKKNREEEGRVEKVQVAEQVPLERVQQFLRERYDFRYNIILRRVEYKERGSSTNTFKTMTDYEENTIWKNLVAKRCPCTIDTLRNVLKSNFSTEYNPFVAYFQGLEPWDGETDFIQQLADSVETTNKEIWDVFFKKWLVGLVACAIDDDAVNQMVLTFSGRQGIGKSTFINNLVPPELRSYYYSGSINPNDKDTMTHLAECLIVNLDEMENLNRSSIGALKEVITRGTIRMRHAYGRNAEICIRRASFAGSVNSDQFLNDPTGSRRFICIEAVSFQHDHNVPIRGVYSQAYTLYQQNYQYWLNHEEQKVLEAHNKQYQRTSVEEELLLQTFTPCDPQEEDAEYLTPTEVARKLSEIYKVRNDTGFLQKLGRVMHHHGFGKHKKSGVYKYCLKQIAFDSEGRNTLEILNS